MTQEITGKKNITERLESGKILPLIIKLSVPAVIAQLITFLYNIYSRFQGCVYVGKYSRFYRWGDYRHGNIYKIPEGFQKTRGRSKNAKPGYKNKNRIKNIRYGFADTGIIQTLPYFCKKS